LISVITVVFNSKDLIRDTIESVLQQTYDRIEFIIIDGASTDGTADIIKEYDHRIDYWYSETDSGIYDAMNKGIRASTGDYLIFLNAGDTFATKCVLSDISKAIVKNGLPDIVYGETNILTLDGCFIKLLKPLKYIRRNISFFGTRTVCHQSIFVSRAITPFYSDDYSLKGELAWYYDIFSLKPGLRAVRVLFPISNYLLGGVGDVSFIKNLKERIFVVWSKENILMFLLAVPVLLMVSIIFKVKRTILSI